MKPHTLSSQRFSQSIMTITLMLSLAILLLPSVIGATYYVSSSNGTDTNDGLTTGTAWRTITQVNAQTYTPGDEIRFKRGDVWNAPNDSELFPPTSGNVTHHIVFADYGTGIKPTIIGSNISCSASDWTLLSSNVWNFTKTVGTSDVGNIYYNVNLSDRYGRNTRNLQKNWSISQIQTMGEGYFYLNRTTDNLFVYSTQNPYTTYGCLYIAVDTTPIKYYTTKFIQIHNFSVAYSGGQGIEVQASASALQLINNDVHHIGGAYYTGTNPTGEIRYGNGIQLWKHVRNATIANNYVWEVYDAALTSQGTNHSSFANVTNQTWSNNIVWNSCIGYEMFFYDYVKNVSGEVFTNLTTTITLDHNTFINIGSGWHENEREISPQTSKCDFVRLGTLHNYTYFNATNNDFFNSRDYAYSFGYVTNPDVVIKYDYNSIYLNDTRRETIFGMYYPGTVFTGDEVQNISQWRTELGYDNNSLYNQQSKYVDLANYDFTPTKNSPVCGAGKGGSDIGAISCTGRNFCEINLSMGYPCVLNSSETFVGGTYYVNGTAITITVNNTILDCNGATIYGNSSHGIFWNNKENITVQNCNLISNGYLNSGIYSYRSPRPTIKNNLVSGYNHGIYVVGSENGTVYNNTVLNSNFVGIYITGSSPFLSNNTLVSTNLIYNVSKYSIANDYQKGISVTNNLIIGSQTGNGTILITNALNNNISLNSLYDIRNTTTSKGIYLLGSNSTNVDYNNIFRVPQAIFLGSAVDTVITNNIIYDADIGLYLYTSSNANSTSNTFYNITFNADGYNIGEYIAHSSANFKSSNDIIEYGHIGIWAQQSVNITIENPTCNQISLTDIVAGRIRNARTWSRAGSNPYHYYEPTSCILLGEQYEGWLGDSTESMADTISKFRRYNVTNVVISGITANSNVQTFLHTVGVFGTKSYSLPVSWNRSFWIQLNLTDQDDFYNNPSWDTLYIVPSTASGASTQFLKSRAGMNNPAFDDTNYTLSKTYMTLYGKVFANVTLNDIGINYSIYNISNASMVMSNLASYNLSIEPSGKYLVYFESLSPTCVPSYNCTTSAYSPGSILPVLSTAERAMLFLVPVAIAAGAFYMIVNGNLPVGIGLFFIALAVALTIIRTIF